MFLQLANIPPPPLRGADGMTTFDIGPLSIAAYGVLIAIGAYVALRVLVRRYAAMGGDPDLAERAALVAIAAAIVGSRIGYVLPRLDTFLADPLLIPQVWRGGLAFFGGVALAVPTTWWYVHRKGGDIARMVDAVAPALPIGHAIGRWGNYFNQELYGRPTDLPWALEVEAHRRVVGFGDAETFHPTFLYESLLNLLLATVLLWIDRRQARFEVRRLRRGSLGFLYFIGYGVIRFNMEQLRIDTAERYLGLSRNSWVALLVIVIGIVGVLWWQRRGRRGDAGEGSGADERTDDAIEDGPDDRAEDGPDDRADTYLAGRDLTDGTSADGEDAPDQDHPDQRRDEP